MRPAPFMALVLSAPIVLAAGCVTGGGPNAPRAPAGGGPPDAAAPAGSAASAAILAGAARRVITPDVRSEGPPVRIGGFGSGRDATGVHDDLEARALVLEAGGSSVAFVALDLIGFFHDDIVKIRDEIRVRHPGTGVATVLVASTHTHAGPDVIGLWTPSGRSVDSGFIARVRSRAAEAVAEAWAGRRPARLSFATTRLPNLIDDSRLPIVIDDLAFLLKVDSADGREVIATLVSFADHPESLGRDNTLISSDYPGALRRALEETFGGTSLFFSADIGGLMTPLDAGVIIDPDTGQPVPRKTYRMTELLGREVAGALAAAWRAGPGAQAACAGCVDRALLETRAREFRVPITNQRFLRGLEEGRIWPREVDAGGTLGSEAAVVSIRAQALAADGEVPVLAQIACVPGEIYPELVVGGIQDPQDPAADFPGAAREAALRPMMSGRYRVVLGLCGDELGYIIPMSEWDEKPPFAYGRSEPQYGEGNSTGPRTAAILLDLFGDLLK